MPQHKNSPPTVAAQIRAALRDGGSTEHAAGVRWFFKDEIKSHGWYTADLRRAVRLCRRDILRDHDFDFLVAVANELFIGSNLEEKIAAVFLLEKMDAQFGDREFRMFESWLDRISSWADHDGLVHLSDCAHGGGEGCSGQEYISLVPIAEALASPGSVCGADSRDATEKILPPDHEALERAAHRSGRHGTERLGLAAARDGEVRCEAHGAVSDEDSRARPAAGIADSVRNAADAHKDQSPRQRKAVGHPKWGIVQRNFAESPCRLLI